MRDSSAPTRSTLAALLLAAAACAGRKDDAAADAADSASRAAATGQTATPAAGTPSASTPRPRGDVAITTPHQAITLALAGDSVWMGLSDSVLTRVRAATDSVPAKIRAETGTKGLGGAFGAMIANTVTTAVGGALKMRVAYPLSDIESARYEDGEIRFTYRPGARHTVSFEDVKTSHDGQKNRPVLASFDPADAQRFVAAVTAAKSRH